MPRSSPPCYFPSPLRYHKTNSELDLIISSNKLKQSGLQSEVLVQRGAKNDSLVLLTRMRHDLQDVIQYVQDPKMLKEKVRWGRARTSRFETSRVRNPRTLDQILKHVLAVFVPCSARTADRDKRGHSPILHSCAAASCLVAGVA